MSSFNATLSPNAVFRTSQARFETLSPTDRQTFRTLYTVNARSVYVTALAILKNPDAAQDVAHDVFLRAWQRRGQYDPSRGTADVWLRAMARNLSIDRLRSARHIVASERAFDEGGTAADEVLSQMVAREQLATIRRAIRDLPRLHRQVIEMAYEKELSHREIAKELCHPLGTVKSRIRQALVMVRAAAASAAEPRQSTRLTYDVQSDTHRKGETGHTCSCSITPRRTARHP